MCQQAPCTSSGFWITYDEHDIVTDNRDTGTVDTYNNASDGIAYASAVGFTAPVPEAVTIMLFSVGLVVLAGYVMLRRSRK